jgi:hypothetical protein
MITLSGLAGNSALQKLHLKYNIANVLGYNTNTDDDLSSIVSTNPSQVAFLHIVANSWDRSTIFDVELIVKMRFYAEMYDLFSPGESLH